MKVELLKWNSASLIALACVLSSTGHAVAQTPSKAGDQALDQNVIQDIIVTAQKQRERLQTIPIAVTAVNSKSLNELHVVSPYDIGRAAPNVQFSGAPASASFFVRGLGQEQSSLLSDPGVAVYVDEVYRPRTVANSLNFTDVDRVEVLRGPQGTLYGKNSIGGGVNIYTTEPAGKFGVSANAELGQRHEVKIDATVNIPISESLLFRVSGTRFTEDGFMHDVITGKDLSNTDFTSVRAALKWIISPVTDLTIRGDYTHQHQFETGSKLIGGGTDIEPYLTSSPYQTMGTADSYSIGTDMGVSATFTTKIGRGDFRSISAYRDFDFRDNDDTDATPLPIQSNPSLSREKFFSQELRYGQSDFSDRLKWTAGLYFIREKIIDDQFPRLELISTDTYRQQTTDSYAAFGQARYQLLPRLSLTAGIRYSLDEKDTAYQAFLANTQIVLVDQTVNGRWHAWTPKASLQYDLNSDTMSYLSWSKGFKSGGVNGSPLQPSDFGTFGPEKVTNYEAGIKSELFAKKLRANLALFHMLYQDIQITVDSPGHIVVENAGKAHIDGVEAELEARPITHLVLNGSLAYDKFKYDRLEPDALATGLTYNDILPYSPPWTANVGAQYTVPVSAADSLMFRSDYSWRSRTYFNATNSSDLAQNSYGLLSARVSYTHPFADGHHWTVYLYGTNLTDKVYHFGGVEAPGATVIFQGRPRQVGAGFGVSL